MKLRMPRGSRAGSAGADIWVPGARVFLQQPVFVPRSHHSQRAATARTASGTVAGTVGTAPPAEDDGWLLVMAHNAEAQCAELHILDALHLTSGPVATIRMVHHLPAAQHASWTGGLIGWPAQAAPRGWAPTANAAAAAGA